MGFTVGSEGLEIEVEEFAVAAEAHHRQSEAGGSPNRSQVVDLEVFLQIEGVFTKKDDPESEGEEQQGIDTTTRTSQNRPEGQEVRIQLAQETLI